MHTIFNENYELWWKFLRALTFCVMMIIMLNIFINSIYIIQVNNFTARTADKIKDEIDKGGQFDENYVKGIMRIGTGTDTEGAVKEYKAIGGNNEPVVKRSMSYDTIHDEINELVNNNNSNGVVYVVDSENTHTNNHANYGTRVKFIVFRAVKVPFFFLPDNKFRFTIKKYRSAVNRGYAGFYTPEGDYGYKKEED